MSKCCLDAENQPFIRVSSSCSKTGRQRDKTSKYSNFLRTDAGCKGKMKMDPELGCVGGGGGGWGEREGVEGVGGVGGVGGGVAV